MYAIFEDGGRQYKVSEGDTLLVDLREVSDGRTEIVFDKVMLVGEGADARIGTPWVAGASVTATIVNEAQKMPKVTGIKFNRRKGYKKKWGHRQRMMNVVISRISV